MFRRYFDNYSKSRKIVDCKRLPVNRALGPTTATHYIVLRSTTTAALMTRKYLRTVQGDRGY